MISSAQEPSMIFSILTPLATSKSHATANRRRAKVQAEIERLRQEGDPLRKERQTLLRQVDALTRDPGSMNAPASASGSSHQETEQRFWEAVAQFETHIVQVPCLSKQFQQSPQYDQLGPWGWVMTSSASQPEVWKQDIFRRQDELGKEPAAAKTREEVAREKSKGSACGRSENAANTEDNRRPGGDS
jgi:hypothetical protein